MQRRVKLSSAPVSARQRLAAAIADLRTAEAEKRPQAISSLGIRGASPPNAEHDRLLGELERAETALAEAATAREAAHRGIAGYPFVDVSAAASPAIRRAEQNYQQAKQTLRVAEGAFALVQDEHQNSRLEDEEHAEHVGRLRRRVDDCVKSVIAEAPGVPALLDQLHRVRQREQELLHALSVIGSAAAEALPQFYDVRAKYNFRSADARFAGSSHQAQAWREAMRRLALDAAVQLPGDPLNERATKAA